MSKSFALSTDLGHSVIVVALLLGAVSLALLVIELLRGRRTIGASLRLAATGVLAVAGLLAAVLRPVSIVQKASLVGPRVVILADASRSVGPPK